MYHCALLIYVLKTPFTEALLFQVLHLYGLNLNFETVKQVVDKCVNLSEVNFSDTKLSTDSVNYVVKNLTPNVQKLSLQNLESVTDEQVSTLVIRCNKLTSLDLFKTSVTNAVLTSIITHLTVLEFLLESLKSMSDCKVKMNIIFDKIGYGKTSLHINHHNLFHTL